MCVPVSLVVVSFKNSVVMRSVYFELYCSAFCPCEIIVLGFQYWKCLFGDSGGVLKGEW